MSFAARRSGHAIAHTSLTATSTFFQPHPIIAAFDPPSSRLVDFAGSNNADLVSFNATAGLESLLRLPAAASDLVGTSKRVVISDPETIKADSSEYQEYVVEVRNYWLEPENFQMLSLKNQRILKMKLIEQLGGTPSEPAAYRAQNVEDDLAVEFVSVTTVSTNDAEPIGNEAEEIAEAEVQREVVNVVQTEDAVVTLRPKNARMLKELG
ncbi:hypothetical protein ACHAWO_001301 [Cyclotella atomus]|uniref:Uncharacterized protein n=1 Tax=Cyclotella atomus TaxID=382360 RepID=A0ABD3NHA8_9STRA